MTTIYRVRIVSRPTDMYAYGPAATSAALAVEVARLRGQPEGQRHGDRLGVYAQDMLPGVWTDAAGHAHERLTDPVLVELLPEE
mgnify:CR=1 FL=1